jgi:hypothetical protein
MTFLSINYEKENKDIRGITVLRIANPRQCEPDESHSLRIDSHSVSNFTESMILPGRDSGTLVCVFNEKNHFTCLLTS